MTQLSSSTCSGCSSVAGRTMARAAWASATRSYRGRVLPPRAITSCVKMAAAAAMRRRVWISCRQGQHVLPDNAQGPHQSMRRTGSRWQL